MPRRRGDGPGHVRARRRAQEAAVRGLVADAVTEAHEAHAAAQHDPAGSARAFLSEAALPAVRALNRAGAPTLLPAMHRIVNAIRPGLISPKAALYGHWMQWRTSNRSCRPLCMGDTMRLTGAGSAMSLHSSAPALLHALRTRCPGDTAPYLNQARATHPGRVSELDAALHLLHPPDGDLEVGEITVFVEGADEAPTRPRPTNPVYDGARPTPPYAVMCEPFPREPTWIPPSRRRRTHPADGPTGTCPPAPPGPGVPTTGGRSSGKSAWAPPCSSSSSRPAGTPSRSWGSPPPTRTGQRPYPAPPSRRPRRGTGYTFLRAQEVTAVTGVHLVRLPSAPPDDPRGPRALSPAPDRELWRDVWDAWLIRLPPQCRLMATGSRPHGANATAGPPSPPPLPPAKHYTAPPTAQHGCGGR